MNDTKDFDLISADTIEAGNKGAEFELLHPATQVPLGIFLKVVGKDSDIFNEKVAEQRNADIRNAQAAQRRGKQPKIKTHEENKLEETELLAGCIIGWRSKGGDYILLKGQKLSYSPNNALMLLRHMPWIKEQVDSAVVNHELFLKG